MQNISAESYMNTMKQDIGYQFKNSTMKIDRRQTLTFFGLSIIKFKS